MREVNGIWFGLIIPASNEPDIVIKYIKIWQIDRLIKQREPVTVLLPYISAVFDILNHC